MVKKLKKLTSDDVLRLTGFVDDLVNDIQSFTPLRFNESIEVVPPDFLALVICP